MILCKASQTAISKAVCYKTKNEQLREKAVHFLLVAINCFYAGLPTVFCTITHISRLSYKKFSDFSAISARHILRQVTAVIPVMDMNQREKL